MQLLLYEGLKGRRGLEGTAVIFSHQISVYFRLSAETDGSQMCLWSDSASFTFSRLKT